MNKIKLTEHKRVHIHTYISKEDTARLTGFSFYISANCQVKNKTWIIQSWLTTNPQAGCWCILYNQKVQSHWSFVSPEYSKCQGPVIIYSIRYCTPKYTFQPYSSVERSQSKSFLEPLKKNWHAPQIHSSKTSIM